MYRQVLLGETPELVSKFISSIEVDREIVREVLLSLIEHTLELHRSNVIDKEKFCKIYKTLRKYYENVESLLQGDTSRYEDIHELIEDKLAKELGVDVAGWIGLGRSRNDHVVTAHKLRLRIRLVNIIGKLLKLRRLVLDLAIRHASTMFIVYTHGQPAQVTTLGHYLISVDESISYHVKLLFNIFEEIVNKSPLGSGPAAGTLAPIDRIREAEDLGFSGIVYTTLHSIETRSYFTITCSVLVNLLVEITRLVNDLILYSHPNIEYIKLPDEHCATSSIMPHKRNPVTLEIIRARVGQAIGYLTGMYTILHSVGKSYYLDLQEVTPLAWSVLNICDDVLTVLLDLLSKIEIREENVLRDTARYTVTSAETAEYLAMSSGRSFREVYFQLAEHFRKGLREFLLPPDEVIKRRKILGSGNPEQVLKYVDSAEREIHDMELKLERIQSSLQEKLQSLLKTCDTICS